jgi:hypothetical protein
MQCLEKANGQSPFAEHLLSTAVSGTDELFREWVLESFVRELSDVR